MCLSGTYLPGWWAPVEGEGPTRPSERDDLSHVAAPFLFLVLAKIEKGREWLCETR